MLLLRRMLKNKLLNWNLLRNKYKELFLLIIIFINVILVYSATFTTITQGDFDNGSYNNTYYNTTHNFTQINITSFYSGNYTSKIFSAGSSSQWNNISWISNSICELPSNTLIESGYVSGNANMTGNVLLMHFNNDTGENGTFFKDFSGLGNNGTCVACPIVSVSGKLNRAIQLDGTTDLVNISDQANLRPSSITVAVWVKPYNTPAGWSALITKTTSGSWNDGWGITNPSSGSAVHRFWINNYNTNTASFGSLPNGVWIFLVGTYNGASILSYRDSVLITNTSYSTAISSSTQTLQIGNGNGAYAFNGTFDEVAIWNRSLSGQEILNLYKRGVARLNLTVRSCDDSACSGESFAGTYNTSVSNLSIANNSFFQYRAFFETDNLSVTPELYNVSVDY